MGVVGAGRARQVVGRSIRFFGDGDVSRVRQGGQLGQRLLVQVGRIVAEPLELACGVGAEERQISCDYFFRAFAGLGHGPFRRESLYFAIAST